MDLLIDGYNLLHVSGIFVKTTGPKALEHLHAAFVEFIATSLTPEDVARTTIVFDAKGRRATARREIRHAGIKIVYAARVEEADTVIGELIQQHHAPRQLMVISSDHQVQRAARRRKAKTMDSELWHAELMRQRSEKLRPPDEADAEKPATVVPPDEASTWLREFEIKSEDEQIKSEPTAPDNPFPPGYGEDVLKEPVKEVRVRKRRKK